MRIILFYAERRSYLRQRRAREFMPNFEQKFFIATRQRGYLHRVGARENLCQNFVSLIRKEGWESPTTAITVSLKAYTGTALYLGLRVILHTHCRLNKRYTNYTGYKTIPKPTSQAGMLIALRI